MLNKTIAKALPYMPKKLVWVFSKKYVAGESISDGIQISKQLNEKGMLVTVDLLGEFITTLNQAEENKNEYLRMIRYFTNVGIKGNFSLKPTSFGLLINFERCYQLLREVVAEANLNNSFVRMDMEDSKCTDLEIELFQRLKQEFPHNVGLVFQAYLYRTFSDLEQLILKTHLPEMPLNVRLCKGIYAEPSEIAYQGHAQVRENFLKCLDLLLKHGVYVGIATHDDYLVDEALKLIEKYKVQNHNYEFQMLYGVRPALCNTITSEGHKMRIYVPFGKDWFGYCSRRLKENPKMVTDIVKALFIKG